MCMTCVIEEVTGFDLSTDEGHDALAELGRIPWPAASDKMLEGIRRDHQHRCANVLDEWTFVVTAEKARVMEERLRIIMQPKPRWLPTFIWRRLLSRLAIFVSFYFLFGWAA